MAHTLHDDGESRRGDMRPARRRRDMRAVVETVAATYCRVSDGMFTCCGVGCVCVWRQYVMAVGAAGRYESVSV